jgi:hypothetical protein
MNLGEKLGLFCRTVLAPVMKTAAVGRDVTCYDGEHALRTIQYQRLAETPRSEFARIYFDATGGRRRGNLPAAIAGMVAMVPPVILIVWRPSSLPRESIALFAVAIALGVYGYVRRLRGGTIPYDTPVNRVRDAWLRAYRCPSCGYALAARAEANASSIRCNECGALWPAPAPPTTN